LSLGERVPKLRFPGFEGEWEEYKLETFMSSRDERQVPSNDAPLMAFIANIGVSPKGDRYDREYLVKSKDKEYKKTEFNDFIYSSNNLDVGSIGLNKYGTAVISDVYEIFTIKEGYAPNFISELIQRPHNLYKVLRFRQGCLYGQYRIYATDFLNVVSRAPHKGEQHKISAFLSLLDSRIAAQRKLVELLKKHKRGLIRRLFSDESSSLKLHFTHDKALCHSVTMGELGKFFGGLSGKTKEDFGHGNSQYVTYMNVYKNIVAILEDCEKVDVSDNETQHRIIAGDIMFTQSSETIEEVGLASLWEHNKNPYLNSFCFAFRLYNQHNIIPKWFVYFMRSPQVRKQIMREGQGITRVNLSSERMKSIKLDIPNTTEQGKVASILDLCDSKINLATKKLEFMDTLKKGLLQQLFV
jgi:type I restriction enzyme S subunit